MNDASQLTPEVAWQALIADREEGNPAALESLRPWLTASAIELVHDRQLAALVAQQVLVDLSARTGQAIRSPEQLEQWLRVRLTQTAALFTGSAWIGTGAAPAISSSIPSALALGASWRLAAWTRRLLPHQAFRTSTTLVTSFAAVLAVGLVASAIASSYSLGSVAPPKEPGAPSTISSPGGVPYLIAPVTLAKPPEVATAVPAPAVTPSPELTGFGPTVTAVVVAHFPAATISVAPPVVPPFTPTPSATPAPPAKVVSRTVPTATPTPNPPSSCGSDAPSPPVPVGPPVGLGRGDSNGDPGVPDLLGGRSGSQWPDNPGLPDGPGPGSPVLGWTQGASSRH